MKIDDRYITDARERMRKKAQNEATCFALNDMLKDTQEEVRRLREENERKNRLFADAVSALAAIDAALGMPEDGCNSTDKTITAIKLMHAVRVDDEKEITRLTEENERLRKDAERGQFLVDRGEWFRHNHDTPHAYALLAIRLPYTADLSCKAMREDAIDAARGAK